MIQSQEDKKLVDEYKKTNIALRKQLNNLNNEIDRILIRRSSKIGLQKLPVVTKKITDPTIMQHQIENLKKKQEQLQKQSEICKQKASINYYKKIKDLQALIQQKQIQMNECKRQIKLHQRKDKVADVQASKNVNKVDQRIAKLQQQISRYQKIQKDLAREINYQHVAQEKATGYFHELVAKHDEAQTKRQKQIRQNSPPPIKTQQKHPQTSIGQQQWRQLKKQFLIFKQSKQNQQFSLNQQNERLRAQIKEWERKIKDKKKRVDSVMDSIEKSKVRQSRVYSTLNDSNDNRVYRYRDRNSAMQYNTKQ